MKNYFLIFSLLFIGLSLTAQTYVDIPWRKGTITKKGKTVEGMIRLAGDLSAPYLNCNKVFFVSNKDWVAGKKPKKKSIETYKAEDIDGYATHTVNKYDEKVNMQFFTDKVRIPGDLIKKKKDVFVRRLVEGKLSLYEFFPMPQKKIVATGDELKKDRERAMSLRTLYLRKGNEGLYTVQEVDLVEYLKDCETVVAKVQNSEYGFKHESSRKERKGLGKMIANGIADAKKSDAIPSVVNDYNSCTN